MTTAHADNGEQKGVMQPPLPTPPPPAAVASSSSSSSSSATGKMKKDMPSSSSSSAVVVETSFYSPRAGRVLEGDSTTTQEDGWSRGGGDNDDDDDDSDGDGLYSFDALESSLLHEDLPGFGAKGGVAGGAMDLTKKMNLSVRVQNDIVRSEKKGEKRVSNIGKDDRATSEQVLDPRTRMILFKLLNNGFLEEIDGCLSTGKEANVYYARGGQGQEYAVKIFKTSILVFKDRDRYVSGEYRFRNGYCKSNPRKMVKTWAEKEMRNLKRLVRALLDVFPLFSSLSLTAIPSRVLDTGGRGHRLPHPVAAQVARAGDGFLGGGRLVRPAHQRGHARRRRVAGGRPLSPPAGAKNAFVASYRRPPPPCPALAAAAAVLSAAGGGRATHVPRVQPRARRPERVQHPVARRPPRHHRRQPVRRARAPLRHRVPPQGETNAPTPVQRPTPRMCSHAHPLFSLPSPALRCRSPPRTSAT